MSWSSSLVFGQVDRGFGGELEREAAGLLPDDDLAQQGFDCLLVADEVVVDDEQVVLAGGEAGFELGDDLGGGLDAGAAAEDDDDVAELAGERAAAGELDAAVDVFAHLHEVEARRAGTVAMSVFPACS